MPPKISIIIPVYNVEQYLRQCLDSVVNQTLKDIQIICVDHSSQDDSCAILEEFVAKDSRIEIVHCENTGGGPGQARNAGLDHVRGKYIYFADSDDWLDPTLCEKAFYCLEQSRSDAMFFYAHEISEPNQKNRKVQGADMSRWLIQTDASGYFDFSVVPWNRVVRTSFLEDILFRFPEGKIPEDNYYHWVLLVHQPQVIFLPQKLYYYRHRADSEVGQRGEYFANHATVYSKIKQYLLSIDEYENYRERFLMQKLVASFGAYNFVLPGFRSKVKQLALETLDEDEIAFIKDNKKLSGHVRSFYDRLLSLKQERSRVLQIILFPFNGTPYLLKKINHVVMRPLENLLRWIQGKLQKVTPNRPSAEQQIQQLSELVCQLSREIVVLRNQQTDPERHVA